MFPNATNALSNYYVIILPETILRNWTRAVNTIDATMFSCFQATYELSITRQDWNLYCSTNYPTINFIRITSKINDNEIYPWTNTFFSIIAFYGPYKFITFSYNFVVIQWFSSSAIVSAILLSSQFSNSFTALHAGS